MLSLILALHLVSIHDSPGFHTQTPGVSIRDAQSGYLIGVLENSEGGTSVFAGRMLETQDKRWAISLGAVTGYKLRPLLPLVTPSFHFTIGQGWDGRINFLPKVTSDGANALHFMLEKKL